MLFRSNDTATTEIDTCLDTLSLHDALPISAGPKVGPELTLNQLFGYNLLVVSALLGLRLLFVVFRSQRRNANKVDDVT